MKKKVELIPIPDFVRTYGIPFDILIRAMYFGVIDYGSVKYNNTVILMNHRMDYFLRAIKNPDKALILKLQGAKHTHGGTRWKLYEPLYVTLPELKTLYRGVQNRATKYTLKHLIQDGFLVTQPMGFKLKYNFYNGRPVFSRLFGFSNPVLVKLDDILMEHLRFYKAIKEETAFDISERCLLISFATYSK